MSDGVFEIHVLRGANASRFVTWAGESYTASGNPEATRSTADLIWAYIVDTYDIVSDGSYVYNGIRAYSNQDPNNGRIGG